MPSLEIVGVKKRYPGFELQPTWFSVEPGEVFAVLGLNGAGKSTLLRMIAGTVLPDAGYVAIDGVRRRPGAPNPALSVVLDGGRSLYWKMSVTENIDYFGALKGARMSTRRARRSEVVERAGLTDKAHNLVGTLSRGMQQRLVLAIAVMCEPRVLLLDEPTIGVDLVHEKLILQAIEALRDRGCAVVLTSHQLDVVERLCLRAIVIDRGQPSAPQAISELQRVLCRRMVEVELEADPSMDLAARLRALGATVEMRSIRVEAETTSVYRLLDAVRPASISSCSIGRTSLRAAMEQLSSEAA